MAMGVEPRVATFFVRCPDPLGFPEKSAQYLEGQYRLSGFANVALHIDEDGTPIAPLVDPEKLFVSARFHVGRRPRSVIRSSLDELGSVLSKVLPDGVRLPPIK